MGARASTTERGSSGALTKEEVQTQVAEIDPTLQRCKWAGPGVLVLKGVFSVYRSDPPLNLAWLEGALSPAEFKEAITTLNAAALGALIGQKVGNVMTLGQLPPRNAQRFQASQAAAAALNEKYAARGVTFTVEIGVDSSRGIAVQTWKFGSDPVHKISGIGNAHKAPVQNTRLYITLPSAAKML